MRKRLTNSTFQLHNHIVPYCTREVNLIFIGEHLVGLLKRGKEAIARLLFSHLVNVSVICKAKYMATCEGRRRPPADQPTHTVTPPSPSHVGAQCGPHTLMMPAPPHWSHLSMLSGTYKEIYVSLIVEIPCSLHPRVKCMCYTKLHSLLDKK